MRSHRALAAQEGGWFSGASGRGSRRRRRRRAIRDRSHRGGRCRRPGRGSGVSSGSRQWIEVMSPWRRRISWQPGMQPAKSFATSKIDAVAVGDEAVERQDLRRDRRRPPTAPCSCSSSATAPFVHTLQWPSSPPLKRSVTSRPAGADRERRHEVGDDVVVVAGVERDALLGARRGDAEGDVERAVAVERRDLDGDDVVDGGEARPEARATGGCRRPPAAGRSRSAASRPRRRGSARSARPRWRPSWRRAPAARRGSRARAPCGPPRRPARSCRSRRRSSPAAARSRPCAVSAASSSTGR